MTPLIVSGSGHGALAAAIAAELGAELAEGALGRFPDGEQRVELTAAPRGRPVFLVQPLGSPIGERLLELLLLADACRRSGAGSVTAVVPYLGLARQDRVTREGQPLGARVLAEALETASLARILAVDLHGPAAVASFRTPIIQLTAVPAIARELAVGGTEGAVLVSPDLGAVKLCEAYAGLLRLPLAVIYKLRRSGSDVEVRSVMGEVRGRRALVVDDMISTGGTIEAALDALLERGARPEVTVAATHGLFVGEARDRLRRPEIVGVLTSDSLPPAPGLPERHRVVPLASLFADAIRRILGGEPLGELLASR